MKKSLLLWIVTPSELDNVVAKVKEVWRPEADIFVFVNRYEIPTSEFYVTWNTTYEFRMPGVIKINRKGSTLFTIDALNQLSLKENGKIDKSWSPNWNEYENQILLSNSESDIVSQIPTMIYEKIKI